MARITKKMLDKAKTLGGAKGKAAADVQYLPGGGRDTGQNSRARAIHMLIAYDTGFPEWATPPNWLSGEWADEPVPKTIAERVGYTADDDGIDEIADAYCHAADEAYVDALLSHLKNVANP